MNISMEDIILRFLSLKFKSNFPKYWNNFRWWIMNIISYLYTYIYTYLRSIACEVLRKIEKMCNKKCGLLQLKIFISVALILWRKKCNLSILHYFSHFSAPLYISGTVWTTYIKWYSICLLIIHCFHVNFRQFKAFPSRWCQPSWYKFKGIGLQSPYPS